MESAVNVCVCLGVSQSEIVRVKKMMINNEWMHDDQSQPKIELIWKILLFFIQKYTNKQSYITYTRYNIQKILLRGN